MFLLRKIHSGKFQRHSFSLHSLLLSFGFQYTANFHSSYVNEYVIGTTSRTVPCRLVGLLIFFPKDDGCLSPILKYWNTIPVNHIKQQYLNGKVVNHLPRWFFQHSSRKSYFESWDNFIPATSCTFRFAFCYKSFFCATHGCLQTINEDVIDPGTEPLTCFSCINNHVTLVCFGETSELNTCKKLFGGDSPRQADQILQAKPTLGTLQMPQSSSGYLVIYYINPAYAEPLILSLQKNKGCQIFFQDLFSVISLC